MHSAEWHSVMHVCSDIVFMSLLHHLKLLCAFEMFPSVMPVFMPCGELPSVLSLLWSIGGRQQMAETNCQRPDTAPIMATIIEASEHTTPKAIDLL